MTLSTSRNPIERNLIGSCQETEWLGQATCPLLPIHRPSNSKVPLPHCSNEVIFHYAKAYPLNAALIQFTENFCKTQLLKHPSITCGPSRRHPKSPNPHMFTENIWKCHSGASCIFSCPRTWVPVYVIPSRVKWPSLNRMSCKMC